MEHPKAPAARPAADHSRASRRGAGRRDCCHRVEHRLRVTYDKPANTSQLLAKSYPKKEDRRVSMTLAQFLTDAWKLAKDKARELGWIA